MFAEMTMTNDTLQLALLRSVYLNKLKTEDQGNLSVNKITCCLFKLVNVLTGLALFL